MNTGTKKLFAMPLLAGITYSLLWLAAGALIASLFLHFTEMKESSLGTIAYVIHGAAALIGGLSSGKRADSRGWYYGSALGILYGIIIIIVSFLASDIALSLHSFLLLLTVIGTGAFGGMVGVNLRK
ncbi:MAG: TIGR04086 family membrane protein [Candidatus Pristimantibacillus lignocellulolyticus]|uniref:TIGR04086 family membrane protein n=1 Tax=Candidatus Pristimantibacillus lignocellulolyticus TaxID=2994561 RepID=A0A9J6ZA73_9BACL|nr:MAG: TIGR04086 family membrane protein [Candidatus Pristimantibacillus lignocellulolyticus]